MSDKHTSDYQRDRDLYEFMLYKFRSGDRDFIMEVFNGDDFLGPSIKKAWRSRDDDSISYNELLNELYLYLAHNNWRRLEGFRGGCELVIWLRTIAANFFKTYFRNNSRQPDTIALDDSHLGVADETDLALPPLETMRSIIAGIISRWHSDNYRRVIDCRILKGLSASDTAIAMNVDRTKSDNYYSIARRRLIKEISTLNYDYYESY